MTTLKMRPVARLALALALGTTSVAAMGWCVSLVLVLRGSNDGACSNTSGGMGGGSGKNVSFPDHWLDCGLDYTLGCERCTSKPEKRTFYHFEYEVPGCVGARKETLIRSEQINRGKMDPC